MGTTVLAQLSVRRGGHVVLTTAIKNDVFTIGRLPSCDLVLPDAAVSKNHAEIRFGTEGAVLTDLESENGTALADERLLPHRPHPLSDGAVIRIGPYDVIYRSQIVTFDDAAPKDDDATPKDEEARAVELDADATDALVAVDGDDDLTDEVPELIDDSFSARRAPPDAVGPHSVSGRYMRYLPVTFQDNEFLARFLGIFEAIWEPFEQRQNHIAMYFSPRTCPVAWLPWLASWFGLAIPDHWPESRVRSLLSEVTELYRWRGTLYGLTRMLEVCTGLEARVSESPEQRFVIRVVVRAPKNARPDLEATLHALIQSHKAAHVGYVLEVK